MYKLKLISEYLNPAKSKLDVGNRSNSFVCTCQLLESLGMFHNFELSSLFCQFLSRGSWIATIL
ncbi:hypothetical protein [Francisella noatunensis]|uniref:hypothetical protein n=1 Tax=Francisella noatunensis TaxID=657445 RepID=UPI001F224BF6|nr:hypothetical protein [Francisella noatunensis]MBK2054719.1 hypothetical protein [Francisella noatunensis]